MVPFELLSGDVRSPLAYGEIQPARTSNALALKEFRCLLIGQKRSGTQPALTPTRVYSEPQARAFFGAGSQLHEMFARFFQNNTAQEVWGIALLDAGAAVAEQRTITITGTITAAGVAAFYFGGHRVAIPVANGETNATTAANLNAAIAADGSVPFIASVASNVVTVTAKNAGALGAEVDIRHSYGATEALPTGMSVAVAVTVAGAGVVSYSTSAIFGLIPQDQFDIIAVGANDSTNLLYVTDELLSRWGPTRQIEGTVYSGFSGDLSASLTQGGLLNSQFSAQLPFAGALSPSWAVGAALAGAVGIEANKHPSRGFHTVSLKGILPPPSINRFTHDEKEQLLRKGMSTYRVAADGTVQIHRLISNNRTTAAGAVDTTWLSMNTVLTLAYLRYDWRQNLIAKYPRHMLADDGTNFAPGLPILTPERGRAEAVAWYSKMEAGGFVERIEDFKNSLVVKRDPNDVNRLNFTLPTNLINQAEVLAALFEFTN